MSDEHSNRSERRTIRVTDKRVVTRPDEAGETPAGSDAGSQAPGAGGPEAAEDVKRFLADLEEATRLAEERKDQLLRLKADFENYRKRVIREQTELVERASLRVVEKLLPVLDDLDRALEAAAGHEGIVRGIEIVRRKLHEVLEEEGLERVVAEGAFDPHEHEAVSSTPGDVTEPTVLEVVRPGYKLKGKTVRPALVHVSVPTTTSMTPVGAETREVCADDETGGEARDAPQEGGG